MREQDAKAIAFQSRISSQTTTNFAHHQLATALVKLSSFDIELNNPNIRDLAIRKTMTPIELVLFGLVAFAQAQSVTLSKSRP